MEPSTTAVKQPRFSQSLSIPMSGSEAIIEASGFQASFHRFLAVCRFHSFRTFHTLYCDVDVRGGLSARGPFMSTDAILLTHLAVNHTSSDEAQWETVIVMSVTDLGLSQRTFTGPLGAACSSCRPLGGTQELG